MSDDPQRPNASEPTARLPERVAAAPPPHPLDVTYFTHFEGETYGPFTGHDIKRFAEEGRVTATTQILRLGAGSWRLAGEEALLASIFRAPAAPQTVTTVSEAAGSTVVHVTNYMPAPRAYADFGPTVPGPKSPTVSLALSFFLSGAGQMYNGEIGKGIAMLVLCLLLWPIYLGWVITIWAMIDAYRVAKTITMRYRGHLSAQSPHG